MLARPRPPAQVRRASSSSSTAHVHSPCWRSTTTLDWDALHALHSSQTSTSSTTTRRTHPRSHSAQSPHSAHSAHLSDQNAELAQKVSALEEEASAKERAGRRSVQRLEREVQVLRGEVDDARRELHAREVEAREAGRHSTRDVEEAHNNPLLLDLHTRITCLEDADVEICREQQELRDAVQAMHDTLLALETSTLTHGTPPPVFSPPPRTLQHELRVYQDPLLHSDTPLLTELDQPGDSQPVKARALVALLHDAWLWIQLLLALAVFVATSTPPPTVPLNNPSEHVFIHAKTPDKNITNENYTQGRAGHHPLSQTPGSGMRSCAAGKVVLGFAITGATWE
ncbi:hypothetical protein F5876DRAFT_73217 [Lentinula aff. lateritia]|uniref:Uncharacterized protein n=1 Tax=Lentinula aff. lateritia TaxID=2804960 RepID=A0ACC1UC25_9AGAR|nr:hypothetical protein F5876DRAFT_73217 [Lentinula aff. lateritia]